MSEITPEHKQLYDTILQTIKAGGCYISGEIVLGLAFLTYDELKKVAVELYIKV